MLNFSIKKAKKTCFSQHIRSHFNYHNIINLLSANKFFVFTALPLIANKWSANTSPCFLTLQDYFPKSLMTPLNKISGDVS